MNRKETELWAQESFEQVVTELGYELVDTEFVQESGEWYLRFCIDHNEADAPGIDVSDCQKVSRAIEALLDENDPIELAYSLEVCSPGLDRAIKKDKDFIRYAGRKVTVKLYKKQDGTKTLEGVLKGKNDGKITIEQNGADLVLDEENVAQVRLAFDFQEALGKKK